MNTGYIIEEFEPDYPWWEEVEDHHDYQEALISLNRLAEAWPESKFRIQKVSTETVYERDASE